MGCYCQCWFYEGGAVDKGESRLYYGEPGGGGKGSPVGIELFPESGEATVLVYGKYTLLDRDNPNVYAYTRELDGNKILVLLNFKSVVATANTGIDLSRVKILLGNYPAPSADGKLRPYEAVIYRL
jgi:hypothetical protein